MKPHIILLGLWSVFTVIFLKSCSESRNLSEIKQNIEKTPIKHPKGAKYGPNWWFSNKF